jgi:hypothetical protein
MQGYWSKFKTRMKWDAFFAQAGT